MFSPFWPRPVWREQIDYTQRVLQCGGANYVDTTILLHVLPSSFHRIRHYGLLANANRKHDIPTFMCCHSGAPMLVIETCARANARCRHMLGTPPTHIDHAVPTIFASLTSAEVQIPIDPRIC